MKRFDLFWLTNLVLDIRLRFESFLKVWCKQAVEAAALKQLGITAMQKLLGKSRFEELLAAYIEKPQGKPTLVPETDKRPAMNTTKNDFMEEYDNE